MTEQEKKASLEWLKAKASEGAHWNGIRIPLEEISGLVKHHANRYTIIGPADEHHT